jgi:hypothetical protein
VLIVEVDDLNAEPLQARLAGLRDIGRATVDAIGAAGAPRLPEFAGNHDAVAPPLEGPAKQFLVLAPTIHVRAVEMIDAEIDRPMDQRDPCRLVARSVNPRQAHAAEADCRDFRPAFAELAPFRDDRVAHRSLLIPL